MPTPLAAVEDLDRVLRSLVSLWTTVQDPDVLVVVHGDADGDLLGQLDVAAAELEVGVDVAGTEAGHVEAANRGLALARDGGADAVLIDPGSEFSSPAWLPVMVSRAATADRPVGVVGARMVKPDGTIHRAGFMFSRLTRAWHARLEWAPAEMPESRLPYRCPVGGGVELIRHEALVAAGVLDPRMPRPLDSIDLCMRAYAAGLDCIYEPAATVTWSGVTPQWPDKQASSPFDTDWHGSDFSPWVPPIS